MTVETHLELLPAAEAEALRGIVARLRAAPERVPSAALAGRVLAAVDAERARGARRIRPPAPWWGFAAAAAVILCASLGVVFLGRMAGGAGGSGAEAEGVAWLAASQEADGTWDPVRHGGAGAYRPALTALAALALAREPGAHAVQVAAACRALARCQQADGSFGGEDRAGLYNHAITTFALASLYAGQPELHPVLERAVAFIRGRQTAAGGWDYEAGSEGNAAVGAWQVRALACAAEKGFAEAEVPLKKGLRWLRGTAREDGSVAYHRGSPGSSESVNALAAYALITSGKAYPELSEAGRFVAGRLRAAAEGAAGADCYRDYAKVLAFEAAGAKGPAESVRRQMAAGRGRAATQDQWGSVGGKLYTTALTALAAK